MHQTKLIQVLKCFDKGEAKEFEAFLESPYFNMSEKVLTFYNILKQYHPDFESGKLDKEKIYKRLHPKSEYNDQMMKEITSALFKLVKEFISHQQLKKKQIESSELRYSWLSDRNLEKLLDAELKTRRVLLDNYVLRDNYFYHHSWQLDQDEFDMTGNRAVGKEYILLKDLDIFAHVHSLNRNYLVTSFSSHIYLLNLRRIYDFQLDEALLTQVETNTLPYLNKGDKLIDILFNTFQLLRTNDEKYFFELKARLFEKDRSVDMQTLQDTGITLENFCAKKLRQGDERFTSEIMQIYRFESDNLLCLNNGKINPVYYCNIAISGIEAGDLDWAEYFTETYCQYLQEDIREGTYNYARSHTLFARKKYTEALRLALSCHVTHFAGKFLIRNLVARAQYELGMLDELDKELTNHRHHLKDEKLTDERRQPFQAFIKLMKQLSDLKGNYNHDKWRRLSDEVEMHKGISNRKWFQEKLAEMKV